MENALSAPNLAAKNASTKQLLVKLIRNKYAKYVPLAINFKLEVESV